MKPPRSFFDTWWWRDGLTEVPPPEPSSRGTTTKLVIRVRKRFRRYFVRVWRKARNYFLRLWKRETFGKPIKNPQLSPVLMAQQASHPPGFTLNDLTQFREAEAPAEPLKLSATLTPASARQAPRPPETTQGTLESIGTTSDARPTSKKGSAKRGLSLSRLLALTLLACGAVFCTVYVVSTWRDLQERRPVRPLELHGKWMKAPGEEVYSSYFIRRLRLSGNVRCAWMAVASTDDFEVTVNGRPVGTYTLWRPTRPFQNDLNQGGQRLIMPQSALSLNFAREYQWEDHRAYLLPVFLDLTRFLSIGDNVICAESRARRAPAMIVFDGGIELWTGEKISISSGPDWHAEPVPPDKQHADWRSHNYNSQSWRYAEITQPPPGQVLRSFDPRIYQTAFRGTWLRHPGASAQDSVWFRTSWQCEKKPDEAWIRLATNRNYEIYINGRRAFLDTTQGSGLENGEWIFSNSRDFDPLTLPETLDPDEVGNLFVRQNFSAPRNDFYAESVDLDDVYRIRKKPASERNAEKAKGGLATVMPKALANDYAEGAFLAYNLTGLLRQGRNTLDIRLARPDLANAAAWAAQVSVDGEISYTDGTRTAIQSDELWRCWSVDNRAVAQPEAAAQPFRVARQFQYPLCSLVYRGTPDFRDPYPSWMLPASGAILLVLLTSIILAGTAWLCSRFFSKNRFVGHALTWINSATIVLWDALLTFTVAIASMLLVTITFEERSEQLWLMAPEVWQAGLAIALALAIVAGLVRFLRLTGLGFLRTVAVGMKHGMRNLPNTWIWIFLIVWISLFSFFIRVYELDFQPLDDDEYPSAQAILSVARTGIPSYEPEAVWYTRSPFYHYVAGASVWLFGENIWALRLPTAFFGVATGILFYLCGSRLLGRPWVGMAALILATLHPHMIFTSHMVRFYQQQQFFSLLMAYFFCRGFVVEQSQRYRYLTLAAFLGATLSQEITAVAGVSLAIGYVLFAENKSWSENIKLFIVAACIMAIVIVDFMIYETHCMTRLEGISPSMQADVGPHFWLPYNFLSLFIGYSRLHLFFGLIFLLGLPAALRERNRVSYALHFLFFSGIVMINLMITQVSLRYQYWLMPLLMLLAVDNARAGLAWLSSLGTRHSQRQRNFGFAPALCMAILLVGIILSWSPWRIPSTYDTKLLADSTGSFQYIRTQLRPGDVVMATQPHAKAMLIETGRSDYEMHIPIIYDFVLRDNDRGILIDRAAGSIAVVSLEQLQKICVEHKRVWIAHNREKNRSQGKKIYWQYPGARLEVFLRKNLQLMHRTHLWDVYLWDADRGHYRPFRVNNS